MKLSDLDHPLIFAVAMVLVLSVLQYVAAWGLTAVGAEGPAALFKGYQA